MANYIADNRSRRPLPVRARGFSLVTVAALGALTMAWLFATSATVLPMYQRTALGRHQTVLRSAAEAGLDYAVAELNRAARAGVVSPIDDPTEDESYSPKGSTVPTAAIGNTGAQVTLEVNNAPAPVWSAVYERRLDAGVSDPLDSDYGFFPIGNKWRTVTVTARYAGMEKRIQAVLKPVWQAARDPVPPVVIPPGTVPFYPFTLLSTAQLTMNDSSSTAAFNSQSGGAIDYLLGDVATNGKAELRGSPTIGGDLEVHSTPKNSLSVVAKGVNTPHIIDEMRLNGMSLSLQSTPGPLGSPMTDNVHGTAARSSGTAGQSYDPVYLGQELEQVKVPPAVSAPASSTKLGALSADSGQTLSLPAGDYLVNSITTNGSGRINLGSGRTRFFVQGNNPGATAVDIGGTSGLVNPSSTPGNLQLWYTGTKNVRVRNSGPLYATTYAPNASVTLSGSGQYYGSVVGKDITTADSRTVNFDRALLDPNQAAKWGLLYSPAPPTSNNGAAQGLFNAYQAISWRELPQRRQ